MEEDTDEGGEAPYDFDEHFDADFYGPFRRRRDHPPFPGQRIPAGGDPARGWGPEL